MLMWSMSSQYCCLGKAVCDETQNLNETESETFFRYQIFSIPNPILFPIPIFFRYRYRYFFRYQNFTKPIPILFSIPKFFETDTDTFFDTKNFRNRYRYHPKKVSKPRSFETEMSHYDVIIIIIVIIINYMFVHFLQFRLV